MFNRQVLSASRVVAWLAIGTTLVCGNGASATQRRSVLPDLQVVAATFDLPDLEKAFWMCDYAGATGGVGMDHAAFCAAINDQLTRRKFAGDFEQMLAWWQRNKVAERSQLVASSRSTQ